MLKLPACLIAAVAVRLVLPLVTGKTAGFKPFRKTGARLASRIGARLKGGLGTRDAGLESGARKGARVGGAMPGYVKIDLTNEVPPCWN